MSNRFLASALQGKNGLGRYCLGILLCLGFTYGVMLSIVLLISIGMSMVGMDNIQEHLDALPDKPFSFFVYEIAIFSLMILGFWLTFRKVHQRPFLTLIRADKTIRWAQIGKGALVALGLSLFGIGVVTLLDPGRYQTTFVAGDWFRFLMPALIAIPVTALLQGIIYAHLLQGLGLLIPKPARLTISFAVIAGLLFQIGQPISALSLIVSISGAYFGALVVLQNQGPEFLLGLFLADSGFELLVLGSPDDSSLLPTILQRVDSTPDLLGTVAYFVFMALFYVICFGLPWQRRVAEFNGHD